MSDNFVESPVILDRTGREIVAGLRTLAAAEWDKRKEEIPAKDVNFYDYDGQIVYAYTRAEFLGLDALPPKPAHTGLVAQGWNWTLAAAKAYVEKYGSCEIGQMYTTDDGKTRLYIRIGRTENYAVRLKFNQSAANGVTINWGDGTAEETAEAAGDIMMPHTYAAEGDYVITMSVADGCSVRLGTSVTNGASIANSGGSASCFFTQGLRTAGGITGRDALVALEIGAGVTDIGSVAFNYAMNLETITIPQEVTQLRALAFVGCVALRSIVIPTGVTAIGNVAFGWLYSATAICLPHTITSLGSGALRQCISVRRLSVPEGVTALPLQVFEGMHKADVISIPDTIAGAVGQYAFEGCYRVVSINIPAGVTSIGAYAFARCHNLRYIELPEGVTTIGQCAFTSCFGIENFVIPSTVTKIDKFAFLYNDGANSFRVKPVTPPVLEPTAFTETALDLVIYVPYSEDHSILAAYLAATGWSGKGDNIREEEP